MWQKILLNFLLHSVVGMQTPHTYCYLQFFIRKIVARLEEVESPCCKKKDSAFSSSKSQMLPSLLPLPGSFFKVLPLPQKFNLFQFPHPCFQHFFIFILFHLYPTVTRKRWWRYIDSRKQINRNWHSGKNHFF